MRDVRFRDAVHAACGESVRRVLSPIVNETGGVLPDTGRFYHADGNSRLARELGVGLEVRTGVRVGEIRGCVVEGEVFDRVLSTAPWPQTLELAGREPANPYAPCLSAIWIYDGDPSGKSASVYGVSDRSGAPLLWSACENHKTGRIVAGRTVIIAQASTAFSEHHLEREPAEWMAILRGLVEERWELPAGALVASHPHRWRYARVSERIEAAGLPAGWDFAGDALAVSRVESAWLEGLAAAERLAP